MTTTTSSTDVDLTIIEVKPGVKFAVSTLRSFLPDIETLLFFGKVYELDHIQLSNVLAHVFPGNRLVQVLTAGDHSTALQDYIVDDLAVPGVKAGQVSFKPTVPHGEILPEMWKQLEIEVAQSIKDVAAKLASTVGHLPGKQGQMVFKSMMVLNRKRPTIGDYKAKIAHAPQKKNLLILDVSSSMSQATIEQIVDDVVALGYMANAHLAVVSNTTTRWEPGNYDSAGVLAESEFGGTHYETLADLMQEEWGTVITVADYDSSVSAKDSLARNCHGTIDQVIDVSLVNRCTYLAECVGQFADKVTPVMVAQSNLTGNSWW